jgi:antirestriction protein ArdC
MQDNTAVQAQHRESLLNAISRDSTMNYAAIVEGFVEKGISIDQIIPRENVFTFNAWKALGRAVRKGEQGVAIVTFVKCKGKANAGELAAADGQPGAGYVRPVRTHVFHVSQTDPIQPQATTH